MTVIPPLPAELARGHVAFVGRRDERAALDSAWQRAVTGWRGVVFVSGEPGIGKTRLVGELATAAHARGAVVLHGHCDPEVLLPYQPFVECFRQLAAADDDQLADFIATRRRALSRVLPELARADEIVNDGDGESERAHLFGACTALLRFAAERAPLLLVIDDLHWASAATVQLLRHVVRTNTDVPLLVTATYRDTEVSPLNPLTGLLADLRTEPGVERIALDGLDIRDVAALAAAAAGSDPITASGDLARTLHEDTAGNPFFVTELVRHLVDTGALVTSERGPALGGAGLPEGVRDVLTLRLARLPEPTREHLTAAAIVGPRFDLTVLGAMGLSGDALDAVEPAVHARLITEADEPVGRFRFAHALVRQALLDDTGATRQARLHEQVGHALEATGAPDADVARHFLAAGRDDLVERGARLALDAATSITWRSAPEAAIDLVAGARRALDEVQGHDLRLEVDLLCEEAMALVVLQRNLEFLDVAGRAVTVARESGSLASFAQAVAARACYTPTGNVDESFIADIEEALGVVDESEISLRSRLHSGLAVAQTIMARDRFAAIEHATIGGSLSDRSGALFDRWMARFAGTLAAYCGPDPTDLARFGDELLRVGDEHDDENARCHGERAAASVALINGDLDRYAAVGAECGRRWAAIHNTWGEVFGAVGLYVEAAARGRFAEAEAQLAIVLGQGGNDPNLSAVYAGELIMLRELQGRLAEMQPIIEMSATAYPSIVSLRIVDGLARLELDRVDESRAIAHETLLSPAMTNRDYMELSRLAWGVQLAAELGETDLLAPLVERLAAWEGQVLVVNLGTAILGRVDAYLGLGRAALGDVDGADRLFAAALEWETQSGCRPLAARTQLWWASSLASRDRAHAHELLDACVATCDDLDIVSVGAHSRSLLASL